MDFPLVSVVIPFYDRVEWLCEAVDSVLSQTYKNIEIIVVNDGSKDDMSSFLEKYNNKIIYILKENGGPASARNKGIEMASGEYIAFLDSDDLWVESKLQKQVEFMKSGNYCWSHTSYRTFGQDGGKIYDISKYNGCVYPYILITAPIGTPCVIIKSEIIKNDNDLRFKEDMRFGQDYYLWIKLAQKYPIGAIKEPLSNVRLRGANAAKRAYVQIKVRDVIWNEIHGSNIENKIHSPFNDLHWSVKFAYKRCSIGATLLNKAEKLINNKQTLEIISRTLYIIPYLIFRLNRNKNSILIKNSQF